MKFLLIWISLAACVIGGIALFSFAMWAAMDLLKKLTGSNDWAAAIMLFILVLGVMYFPAKEILKFKKNNVKNK